MSKKVKKATTKLLPAEDNEEGERTEHAVDNISEGTDDDDCPVGISWKESQEVFRQDEKNRKEAVDFLRLKEKEKRRKKNEMFLSQKRSRTSELTKLPEDIVLAVAKKSKVDIENKKTEKESVDKVKEKQKSPTKSKRKEKIHDGLLKKQGHYKILVVEDEVKKPKKIQDTAAAFLENHLYGNRLHRTSPSSNLTSQHKSSGTMKPAVKFSSRV